VAPDGSAAATIGVALDQGYPESEATGWDFRLTVVDLQSGRVRFSKTVGPGPLEQAVDWQPGGDALAAVGADGSVSLFHARSGRRLLDPVEVPHGVTAVHFSAEGDVLLVADGDGRLRPLDPSTGRLGGAQVLSEGGYVVDMDVLPSRRMIAAVNTGLVHVLELPTGHPVGRPLQTGAAFISQLAVSPDGARVAALDWDGALRFWDVATRRQVGPAVPGFGQFGLGYLDEGRTLVTGGFGTPLFIEADPESWRTTACRLVGRNLTPEEWTTYLPDEPERPTCTED
jgi:hypothetical protein